MLPSLILRKEGLILAVRRLSSRAILAKFRKGRLEKAQGTGNPQGDLAFDRRAAAGILTLLEIRS
jgi:hypothetical protein